MPSHGSLRRSTRKKAAQAASASAAQQSPEVDDQEAFHDAEDGSFEAEDSSSDAEDTWSDAEEMSEDEETGKEDEETGKEDEEMASSEQATNQDEGNKKKLKPLDLQRDAASTKQPNLGPVFWIAVSLLKLVQAGLLNLWVVIGPSWLHGLDLDEVGRAIEKAATPLLQQVLQRIDEGHSHPLEPFLLAEPIGIRHANSKGIYFGLGLLDGMPFCGYIGQSIELFVRILAHRFTFFSESTTTHYRIARSADSINYYCIVEFGDEIPAELLPTYLNVAEFLFMVIFQTAYRGLKLWATLRSACANSGIPSLGLIGCNGTMCLGRPHSPSSRRSAKVEDRLLRGLLALRRALAKKVKKAKSDPSRASLWQEQRRYDSDIEQRVKALLTSDEGLVWTPRRRGNKSYLFLPGLGLALQDIELLKRINEDLTSIGRLPLDSSDAISEDLEERRQREPRLRVWAEYAETGSKKMDLFTYSAPSFSRLYHGIHLFLQVVGQDGTASTPPLPIQTTHPPDFNSQWDKLAELLWEILPKKERRRRWQLAQVQENDTNARLARLASTSLSSMAQKLWSGVDVVCDRQGFPVDDADQDLQIFFFPHSDFLAELMVLSGLSSLHGSNVSMRLNFGGGGCRIIGPVGWPQDLLLQVVSYDGSYGNYEGPTLSLSAHTPASRVLGAIGREIGAAFGPPGWDLPSAARWIDSKLTGSSSKFCLYVNPAVSCGYAHHISKEQVAQLKTSLGDRDLQDGQAIEYYVNWYDVDDYHDFWIAFGVPGTTASYCVIKPYSRFGEPLIGMLKLWDDLQAYKAALQV